MFYILSQNGERLYNMNGHIEGIGYEEAHDYKRTARGEKKEKEVRHTLQIFDGCAEEVAEYQTKEECLKVLQMIAFNVKQVENGNIMVQLPTQEELPDVLKTWEQLQGMFKQAAGEVSDGLKELFEVLNGGGI